MIDVDEVIQYMRPLSNEEKRFGRIALNKVNENIENAKKGAFPDGSKYVHAYPPWETKAVFENIFVLDSVLNPIFLDKLINAVTYLYGNDWFFREWAVPFDKVQHFYEYYDERELTDAEEALVDVCLNCDCENVEEVIAIVLRSFDDAFYKACENYEFKKDQFPAEEHYVDTHEMNEINDFFVKALRLESELNDKIIKKLSATVYKNENEILYLMEHYGELIFISKSDERHGKESDDYFEPFDSYYDQGYFDFCEDKEYYLTEEEIEIR